MFEIDYIWVVALLYISFDVNYFIRALLTLLFGGIFHRKCKITDTTVLHGICLTNDVDMMLCHMNNARYLRELDFARYHFYERTRLFRRLFNARTLTLQTASCIRYRQSIGLFSFYTIRTKLVYWDERNVYLEHRFETSDGCVRAVGMSRQTILSGTVPALFEGDPPEDRVPPRPPVPSEELRHWLSSMEASSQLIKSTTQAHRSEKEEGVETKFNGYINR